MFSKLLLVGILGVASGFAQGRGGGGGGGMGDGMSADGGGMGEGGMLPNAPRVVNRIDILAEELKLDKDQKKKVKTILDEAQKEANPLREQLAKARLAIGEAIQSGKSQDDIKPLVNGEAVLESQMVGIELNAFAKIYKGLESEQRSQTRGLFQMMKGIFDGKNWNYAE